MKPEELKLLQDSVKTLNDLSKKYDGLSDLFYRFKQADKYFFDKPIVLSGGGIGYDDLRFPATAINPAGLTSPMTFDTTNIGFLANATATQSIGIIAQLPHSWKQESTIRPHIHWMPTTTNTGNVLWRMEYKWTNINDTESGSWTTLDILGAGSGTAFKHQLISFGAISGVGMKISSILSIKISRIGGDASDTYTADALLKEVDIHFEIDSVGSKNLYVK